MPQSGNKKCHWCENRLSCALDERCGAMWHFCTSDCRDAYLQSVANAGKISQGKRHTIG